MNASGTVPSRVTKAETSRGEAIHVVQSVDRCHGVGHEDAIGHVERRKGVVQFDGHVLDGALRDLQIAVAVPEPFDHHYGVGVVEFIDEGCEVEYR